MQLLFLTAFLLRVLVFIVQFKKQTNKYINFLTSNLGLEGASDNVIRTTVFDGNEIVPRSHWGVCDPVALRTLNTVHLHLGGPIDGHS